MARRSSKPPAILVIVLAEAAFLLLRIKTIFDNDAKRINFQPRPISVSELASLPTPEVLSDERSDAEKTITADPRKISQNKLPRV